jgi:stage III sporulation protein AA
MDKRLLNDFNYIISYTTPRIQSYLKKINYELLGRIQEIRIRAERPLVLILDNESFFLNATGKITTIYSSNCVFSFQNDITDIVNKICGYSLHSHYEDLLNGYITLKNGARIGLTGTAVFDKTNLKGIKDIDGLNIRIPRQIKNFSSVIFNNIYKDTISNLLIAGPPSSGKTTMLKDLAYQLSSGKMCKLYKVCIVDERKEIANYNKTQNDLGFNTDVMYGYPKHIGISIAVRCLSPDIIICDEISSEDVEEVVKAMNSGIKFVFSIHAKNYEELKRKFSYQKLFQNGCVENILFLNNFNKFTLISDDIIKEVVYETNNDFINNHTNNNSNT